MESLLNPKTIAVIGASADEAKISGKLIPAIKRGGFEGALFAVNPGRQRIGDVPCLPTVEDIDVPVDLAVIAVAVPHVASALESCARKGVGSVILHTGGFAETGPEGQAREDGLREFAERTGIRILGPNCQGVLVPSRNLCATFNGILARPENRTPGDVAWISQSGAVGGIAVSLLRAYGLGVSLWASTGNEADLDFSSLAGHALDQPETRMVCGYLERVKDVTAFREVASKALRLGKPIILVRGGASESGAAAAQSHTGAIVGDDRIYRGMFAQLGVVAVHSFEELAATASLFHGCRPPAARRIGIVGNSGGTGVVLADQCERLGLAVPSPPPGTVEALASMLPDFIRPSNPVDIPMQIRNDPAILRQCIETLHGAGADRPEAYIACLHSIFADDAYDLEGIVTALAGAQESTGAPVLLVPYGCDDRLPALARAAGVAALPDGPRAIGALANAAAWATARARRMESPVRVEALRTALGPRDGSPEAIRHLPEHTTKSLLREAGFAVVPGTVAGSPDGAVAAAEGLGYPVVAKLVAPHVPHKTEVGAVKLGLSDAAGVRAAYEELAAIGAGLAPSEAAMVLVERMAPAGDDIVVAVRRDPDFGAVLMLGIGGVLVEAVDDIAVRLLPVGAQEVAGMVGELGLAGVLSHRRGRSAPADVAWLAAFVEGLQQFVAGSAGLVELELNPVRLFAEGEGGLVLDALSTYGD